ncbi:hypothetical protein C8J57DRAFT_387664 [Mycena rebaudengoi]|nr:hypothetical protein C8J57DRAFT_387664 [Mycena rebaudengoi]
MSSTVDDRTRLPTHSVRTPSFSCTQRRPRQDPRRPPPVRYPQCRAARGTSVCLPHVDRGGAPRSVDLQPLASSRSPILTLTTSPPIRTRICRTRSAQPTRHRDRFTYRLSLDRQPLRLKIRPLLIRSADPPPFFTCVQHARRRDAHPGADRGDIHAADVLCVATALPSLPRGRCLRGRLCAHPVLERDGRPWPQLLTSVRDFIPECPTPSSSLASVSVACTRLDHDVSPVVPPSAPPCVLFSASAPPAPAHDADRRIHHKSYRVGRRHLSSRPK